MDATKDVNSAVEKAVQDLTTKYANTIDGVFDKLNKKITGGKGLEYIGEEW
jgi:ribosome recycling factor